MKPTDASEEHIASIFKVEEEERKSEQQNFILKLWFMK
jgi:hypothetical protein